MLTAEMAGIIRSYSAGMVATVNGDGTPAVSPKATFVIIDNSRIAFGNIRSPGTVANLRRDPRVEVGFLDVLARKSVRVAGIADIMPTAEAPAEIVGIFHNVWTEYLPNIREIVLINIQAARLILSPAYDIGYTEDQLKSANRSRIAGG